MSTYIKKTACPYDCPTTCSFCVETDGQKIFRVFPEKNHPVNQGILCQKMRHYEKDIHDPERILTPLKRVGKKGSGEFEAISWEQAAAEISDRWKKILRTHGPEAITYNAYSGVMSLIQRHCGEAFFHYLGAKAVEKTLCSGAKGAGYSAVVGNTGCLDPRELKDSDFYLVWGCRIHTNRLQTLSLLVEARKQGKRVLLIDVCGEGMEAYFDDMIFLQPGSDGALALAMMHVLQKYQLIDEEFMMTEAIGYPEFALTLPQYTPEWASEITGIPASVIEALALEYGKAYAPAIILGSGNSRYLNGGMNVRLITILSLLTGAWKKPGGGLCGTNPSGDGYMDQNLIKRPDFRRKNNGSVNINQMAAVLSSEASDKIYSYYVYGTNPANSVSAQKQLYEALSREDLFTIVHERYLTDTARYADIILPAAFSVEQSDVFSSYGYCSIGSSYKIIEPAGQCKSNWNTFCLLAKAMGFEDEYFSRSEEDMVQMLLETIPEESLSAEDRTVLAEGGMISLPFSDHTNWKTPSKKITIVNDQQPLPIPCYTEASRDGYPYRIVSLPALETLNSIFITRAEQAEARGEMKIIMNAQDAEKEHIQSGDLVRCFNDIGEVVFRVCRSSQIAPGTLAVPGVYSSKQTFNGFGVNALQHGRLSDIGAATTMNDNSVSIEKI